MSEVEICGQPPVPEGSPAHPRSRIDGVPARINQYDLRVSNRTIFRNEPPVLFGFRSAFRHLSGNIVPPADKYGKAAIAVATAQDNGSNPERNTMELASSDSIRALMQGYGIPKPVLLRRGAQSPARPAKTRRKGRCKCGQCRQCLEDARWERIFAEKFADPNYYTNPATRGGSSLAAF